MGADTHNLPDRRRSIREPNVLAILVLAVHWEEVLYMHWGACTDRVLLTKVWRFLGLNKDEFSKYVLLRTLTLRE